MFKIEKNIQIPPLRGASKKYPLSEMEIGDSFLVPCDKEDADAVRNRVTQNFYSIRPKRFTGRVVEGGVRVWRIDDSDALKTSLRKPG